MSMTHEPQYDGVEQALEDRLMALRAAAPVPRPGFLNALVAEAEAMQPRPARHPAPVPLAVRIRAAAEALGGWRAGLTLAGSAMAGLALGYFQPAAIDGIYEAAADTEFSVSAVDERDPLDTFLAEIGA